MGEQGLLKGTINSEMSLYTQRFNYSIYLKIQTIPVWLLLSSSNKSTGGRAGESGGVGGGNFLK